jgi:hypothetical protein
MVPGRGPLLLDLGHESHAVKVALIVSAATILVSLIYLTH